MCVWVGVIGRRDSSREGGEDDVPLSGVAASEGDLRRLLFTVHIPPLNELFGGRRVICEYS